MTAVSILAIRGHAAGQMVTGRLLEAGSGKPIELGVVELISVTGDTVGRAFSADGGSFQITSAEPGDFVLSAAAFGYRTTRAGVLELGAGGEMSVEVRLHPDPIELDAMLVALHRPVLEHPLVTSGFVDRFTQGFGKFITPVDIARSPARQTTDLFRGIPGVSLVPPRPTHPQVRGGGGTLSYAGDQIVVRGQGRWCVPVIYLDGIPIQYENTDVSIDVLAPLGSIDGVEIYRSPAEIPVQYNRTRNGTEDLCGVILFWTKKR